MENHFVQYSVPVFLSDAQETERLAIADELHTNLCQIICAAKMYLNYVETEEGKKSSRRKGLPIT